MSVNLEQALGHALAPRAVTYTPRDAALYALAIGAAADPVDAAALRTVYELSPGGLQVWPTFAATFLFAVFDQLLSVPGLAFSPVMLLHGEHALSVPRPLPPGATVTNHARISHIYDKGKGALVMLDVTSRDGDGREVALNQAGLFIRGLGGFGGPRGPSGEVNLPPARPPDAVVTAGTLPQQALLYRLAGSDPNPLHADPAVAAMAGFDRPILHGLCTFGFAVRAVLDTFAGGDPGRFRHVRVRFSRHVFPGETIRTEMWRASNDEIIFQARVVERDEVVLSRAAITLAAAEVP